MYSYQGNYAHFLERKAERLANEDAAIQAAKSKYSVELEWMRRQPQARATKQKVGAKVCFEGRNILPLNTSFLTYLYFPTGKD